MTNEKSSIVAIFGANLKTCRKKAGLTQEQLAEKAGVTVKYISNIECQISFPSAQVISSLSNALGIPEFKLFLPENLKQDSDDEYYISKTVLKKEINNLVKALYGKLS